MLTRRNFLKSSSVALPAFILQSQAGFPKVHQPIGLQLYTVRNLAEKNLPEVLKQVRAIGYQEVETYWNVYSHPAKELRHMIDDAGLSAPSGHFNYDGFQAKIDYAKQLGLNWMVCPMLPLSQQTSEAGFHTAAKQFNEWGKLVQNTGMQFAFHNHDYEFKPYNGKTGYQILLDETDPALVFFEMDCYWIAQSGNDPVEMLHRLGHRVRLLHLKDRKPGFPPSFDMGESSSHFTEVGHGNINWKAVIDTAEELGIEYYFVEQDHTPGDPMASIRSSYQYLRTIIT
ncbi:MAG TPA: sugar phosphate isomerase/epimerase [Silvibacterium sp.]|nr:sugar phosphate isomerase/epimerase [Silvibacterium sp.]